MMINSIMLANAILSILLLVIILIHINKKMDIEKESKRTKIAAVLLPITLLLTYLFVIYSDIPLMLYTIEILLVLVYAIYKLLKNEK